MNNKKLPCHTTNLYMTGILHRIYFQILKYTIIINGKFGFPVSKPLILILGNAHLYDYKSIAMTQYKICRIFLFCSYKIAKITFSFCFIYSQNRQNKNKITPYHSDNSKPFDVSFLVWDYRNFFQRFYSLSNMILLFLYLFYVIYQ